MITTQTYKDGTYTTVTETKLRRIIINILHDFGFIDNSFFGEGSYGEFDHDKYSRYTKWTVIGLLIILIVAIINGKKD